MKEKLPKSCRNRASKGAAIVSLTPDGASAIVFAADNDSAEELNTAIEESLGVKRVGESDLRSGKTFATPRWNSPWEPKGPKPNYVVSPQKPGHA